MRLLTYADGRAGPGRPRTGVLVDEVVVPLAALTRIPSPGDQLDADLARLPLVDLLGADPGLDRTRRALASVDPGALVAAGVPIESVRLLAPLLRPGKIVCVGLNYASHVAEQGVEPPSRPMLFAKFANTIVGDGAPIVRPAATHALDLEVELALVIGRTARRVPAARALEVVAGYTGANDISARDLQGQKAALAPGERGDGQWLRAKGSDTFMPLGPVLVSSDEIADPSGLRLRSWRTPAAGPDAGRDVPMQDSTTGDMVFDVPALVEFATAVVTLEPGDVVITGTPAGVGVFRQPPIFLEPGDVVRTEVESIGSLANPIVDADGTAPTGSPAARLLAARA